MRLDTSRILNRACWSVLWIVFFWVFLVIGLPTEEARDWLVERLGRHFDATFAIEELRVRWNLGVSLKGISITSRPSESRPFPGGQAIDQDFGVRLDVLNVEPRLSSLMLAKPDMDFNGSTPSGGRLAGSYKSGELYLSFQDMGAKDFMSATSLLPAGSTMRGSGRLRLVTGNATIDTEVDGIPGAHQRLKIVGGKSPGFDGKLKITVSLPKS